MRFLTLSSPTCVLFSLLCTSTQAWPLFHPNNNNNQQKRNPEPAPQSYSVVAVGGPSSQPTATTIINVVTQTQVQTLVSTVTTEGAGGPTTIITTQLVATTVTQSVPVTVTAESTVAGVTETMVVEPSVTSIPYDNGEWHTTYFYRSTINGEFVTQSSATVTATPSIPSWEVISSPSSLSPVSPSSTETTETEWSWSSSSSISSLTTSASTSTGTITAVNEWTGVTATSSSSASTSTDWATYYGTWHETPKNGSWWGKRELSSSKAAVGAAVKLPV